MVDVAKFIPWIPGVAAALCALCAIDRRLHRLAGWCCVISIAVAFLMSVGIYSHVVDPIVGAGGPEAGETHAAAPMHLVAEGGAAAAPDAATPWHIAPLFQWIHVGNVSADFSYFLDPLTMVMLFVVTGIGTLIAIYATGYMKGDPGYPRFFASVALFIFAMLHLVMADNLILLFLGWEGVGLCSYLLIGYYYKYDVAVAAAKKAFIVNRIGDLGFALGIFLTYREFGSVEFATILPAAQQMLASGAHVSTSMAWIPFLLMIGAFGKSAQIPLFVWLPDAMAGPTPVSALVHAATMVTSGVYMIARMTPVFALTPESLLLVALVGGVTALFAATIALCSNDLKGVFAYSTVSQLGYMFVGVAAISVGGVFHLFTHAFFKALLFLTAGSVMHALAGTLDIRTMSGLRKKMPITCWLMFAGCLALAGFPFTAGFYSKDLVLGDALVHGLHSPYAEGTVDAGLAQTVWMVVTVLGVVTAALTAFYTFRLWFRVFMGEEKWAMGDADGRTIDSALERAMVDVAKEHHAHDSHTTEHEGEIVEEAAAADPHRAPAHASHEDHPHHAPHEMPWVMNAPLIILALGALLGGVLFEAVPLVGEEGWIGAMLGHSTQMLNPFATAHAEHPHVSILGLDAHLFMLIVSSVLAVGGIALAAYFHWYDRHAASKVAAATAPIVKLLRSKWFVDEGYDWLIVRPLRVLANVLYGFDQLVINGLVLAVGRAPGLVGEAIRPLQSGKLQGYGVGMATGVGVILAILFWTLVS